MNILFIVKVKILWVNKRLVARMLSPTNENPGAPQVHEKSRLHFLSNRSSHRPNFWLIAYTITKSSLHMAKPMHDHIGFPNHVKYRMVNKFQEHNLISFQHFYIYLREGGMTTLRFTPNHTPIKNKCMFKIINQIKRMSTLHMICYI